MDWEEWSGIRSKSSERRAPSTTSHTRVPSVSGTEYIAAYTATRRTSSSDAHPSAHGDRERAVHNRQAPRDAERRVRRTHDVGSHSTGDRKGMHREQREHDEQRDHRDHREQREADGRRKASQRGSAQRGSTHRNATHRERIRTADRAMPRTGTASRERHHRSPHDSESRGIRSHSNRDHERSCRGRESSERASSGGGGQSSSGNGRSSICDIASGSGSTSARGSASARASASISSEDSGVGFGASHRASAYSERSSYGSERSGDRVNGPPSTASHRLSSDGPPSRGSGILPTPTPDRSRKSTPGRLIPRQVGDGVSRGIISDTRATPTDPRIRRGASDLASNTVQWPTPRVRSCDPTVIAVKKSSNRAPAIGGSELRHGIDASDAATASQRAVAAVDKTRQKQDTSATALEREHMKKAWTSGGDKVPENKGSSGREAAQRHGVASRVTEGVGVQSQTVSTAIEMAAEEAKSTGGHALQQREEHKDEQETVARRSRSSTPTCTAVVSIDGIVSDNERVDMDCSDVEGLGALPGAHNTEHASSYALDGADSSRTADPSGSSVQRKDQSGKTSAAIGPAGDDIESNSSESGAIQSSSGSAAMKMDDSEPGRTQVEGMDQIQRRWCNVHTRTVSRLRECYGFRPVDPAVREGYFQHCHCMIPSVRIAGEGAERCFYLDGSEYKHMHNKMMANALRTPHKDDTWALGQGKAMYNARDGKAFRKYHGPIFQYLLGKARRNIGKEKIEENFVAVHYEYVRRLRHGMVACVDPQSKYVQFRLFELFFPQLNAHEIDGTLYFHCYGIEPLDAKDCAVSMLTSAHRELAERAATGPQKLDVDEGDKMLRLSICSLHRFYKQAGLSKRLYPRMKAQDGQYGFAKANQKKLALGLNAKNQKRGRRRKKENDERKRGELGDEGSDVIEMQTDHTPIAVVENGSARSRTNVGMDVECSTVDESDKRTSVALGPEVKVPLKSDTSDGGTREVICGQVSSRKAKSRAASPPVRVKEEPFGRMELVGTGDSTSVAPEPLKFRASGSERPISSVEAEIQQFIVDRVHQLLSTAVSEAVNGITVEEATEAMKWQAGDSYWKTYVESVVVRDALHEMKPPLCICAGRYMTLERGLNAIHEYVVAELEKDGTRVRVDHVASHAISAFGSRLWSIYFRDQWPTRLKPRVAIVCHIAGVLHYEYSTYTEEVGEKRGRDSDDESAQDRDAKRRKTLA